MDETDGAQGQSPDDGLVARFRAALADDVDLPGALAVALYFDVVL